MVFFVPEDARDGPRPGRNDRLFMASRVVHAKTMQQARRANKTRRTGICLRRKVLGCIFFAASETAGGNDMFLLSQVACCDGEKCGGEAQGTDPWNETPLRKALVVSHVRRQETRTSAKAGHPAQDKGGWSGFVVSHPFDKERRKDGARWSSLLTCCTRRAGASGDPPWARARPGCTPASHPCARRGDRRWRPRHWPSCPRRANPAGRQSRTSPPR